MPQGDRSSYSPKQKRKARHIEKGYEARGTPKMKAARIAWATVNKEEGGAKVKRSNARTTKKKPRNSTRSTTRTAARSAKT